MRNVRGVFHLIKHLRLLQIITEVDGIAPSMTIFIYKQMVLGRNIHHQGRSFQSLGAAAAPLSPGSDSLARGVVLDRFIHRALRKGFKFRSQGRTGLATSPERSDATSLATNGTR